MRIIVALLAFKLTTLSVAAADVPKKPSNPFKITTKKADDSVEVQVKNDGAVFAVKSPTGISHAIIERVEEKWPATVTVRMYLKGLESVRISNGKVALAAAVSSHDGSALIWKDGQENGLDAKSPFWMEIRLVGDDGKPTTKIPLKDGYFEMTLPKVFFEGNPPSITLNWIDFYRN